MKPSAVKPPKKCKKMVFIARSCLVSAALSEVDIFGIEAKAALMPFHKFFPFSFLKTHFLHNNLFSRQNFFQITTSHVSLIFFSRVNNEAIRNQAAQELRVGEESASSRRRAAAAAQALAASNLHHAIGGGLPTTTTTTTSGLSYSHHHQAASRSSSMSSAAPSATVAPILEHQPEEGGLGGLNEAVEPLDYEEFVLQQQRMGGGTRLTAAPANSTVDVEHLVDFPPDDIEVNIVEKSKKIRTMNHVLPEEPL